MSEAAASSGRADGLTSLSEGSNNNAKSSRQFGKKHPSPRFIEGQLGRGPCARFETPVEQGSKASQKAPNCTASSEKAPFATLKQHGSVGWKASRRCPVGRHQVAF